MERYPPPGDGAWKDAVKRLHTALKRAGYSAIARVPTSQNPLAAPLELANLAGFFLGASRRLMEPSAIPGVYRALEKRRAPARAQQLAFFFLGEPQSEDELDVLLRGLDGAPSRAELAETKIIEPNPDGRGWWSRLRFVPVGEMLFVVDRLDRSLPGYTYLGRDSLVFSERLRRALHGRSFERGLDLCCGSGVQALSVASNVRELSGTDLNARAVAFASLNAELAGVADRAKFQVADLAEGLSGKFDLVIANPPYVWMPEDAKQTNLDGYGGELGLEVVRRILEELDRLLTPNGEAHFVCEAPVMLGQSALERVAQNALRGKPLVATLTPLWYAVHRNYQQFHRAQGASHIVYYHVHVARSPSSDVRLEALPPVKHALYSAYVRLASYL